MKCNKRRTHSSEWMFPGFTAQDTTPSAPYLFASSFETRTFPFECQSDAISIIIGNRVTSLLCRYRPLVPLRLRAGLSRSVLKSIVPPSAAKEAVVMIRECPSGEVFTPAINAGRSSFVKRNGLTSSRSIPAEQRWMTRTQPRWCRIVGRNRRR
jgi:hypothetical protein